MQYTTKSLTAEDGLSQNDILNICQDSYGFVWIATNDGLNRYDGLEFKLFKKGELGLESNLVLSICEDSHKNLWIATADHGLFYYIRDDNRFLHISQMSDDSRLTTMEATRYVVVGKENELWVYTRMTRSIIKIEYNPDTLRVSNSTFFSISPMTYAQCSGLQYIDGDLYAYTYWGLLKYSSHNQRMERIKDMDYTIRDIKSHGDKLYIATPVGLFSYGLSDGVKQRILPDLKMISRVCWDGDNLYVATNNGVYVTKYDDAQERFESTQKVDSFYNFNTNQLKKINTGGVWAGFDKEAIRIYQQNTKPFRLINGFGNNHVVSGYVDQNNNMLVGTEGSGYFELSSKDKRGDTTASYLDGLAINAITYSAYTSKYYMATSGGIYKCKERGEETKMSTLSTTKSMVADGKYLWAGCYSNGLKRIDLDSEEIKTFAPNNSSLKSDIVRSVVLGQDGKIWFSTSKGLYMIESDDKDSIHPKLNLVLPEVTEQLYIVPVMESSCGDIWFGTIGSGVYRLERKGGSYVVEKYTTDNILPSNTIMSIVEDKGGLIWMSFSGGLCSIDTARNSVTTYGLNNGLKDSYFHSLTAWCTPDNRLIFGGVKGLTMFEPKDIIVNYTQGVPHLTNFEIFNKSVLELDDCKQITPRALEAAKSLNLEHDQNSFTFSFSSFNYTGPRQQQYFYKLEGFDKEWQAVRQNHSEVSYTNMSFGSYRFMVRCKNEDGLLNPKELAVDVVIAPPFWLRWYAILLYVVVLVAVVYIIAGLYKERLKRRNAVKLAKMEKAKIEELLQVRTNFFTNVSHEFRTPLTLILSPLQQLKADEELMSNSVWRNHLNTMSFNGESLMRLANDFLNFSKRESHVLKLDLHLGRLDLLLDELSKHLLYMAKSKGVKLRYEPAAAAVEFYFDAAHIEQIIYNLTSNAIKHTPLGGEVSLDLCDDGEMITLKVVDSGVGIPLDMQPHIFERFVSRDSIASNESSGIGIGLSLTKDLVKLHNGTISFESVQGSGTTFVVVLPKHSNDELGANILVAESAAEQESAQLIEMDDSELVAELVVKDTTTPQEQGDGDNVEGSNDLDVILIVDDNEQLVKLLCSLFSDTHKVLTAYNGEDALMLSNSFIPDLIISDIMMPGMDGYELCQRIKGGENTSHIPLILLSAKGSNDDVVTGYRYKADGYCVKPFNNEILIEMVRSMLDNRRILGNQIKHCDSVVEVEQIGISSDADKQMVKRLVSFIEENMSNPDLVVGDVCVAVGLTQVVLNKKLRALFNMTANAMIRNIRLKRAAELLRTGRYTVSSITYDVGFNDLRHFRELFLKEYGMFPQAYKKKYNETDSSQEE